MPRKKEVTHGGQSVGRFIQQPVNFLVVVVENLGAVSTDAGVRGVVDETVAAHQQHVSMEIIKLFIPSTLQKMRRKKERDLNAVHYQKAICKLSGMTLFKENVVFTEHVQHKHRRVATPQICILSPFLPSEKWTQTAEPATPPPALPHVPL